MHNIPDELMFTVKREEEFYSASELEAFKVSDDSVIFDFLIRKMNPIPFCDYLKRYIYIKAEMNGDYKEIGDEVYQKYIVESFRKTGTPPSFTPTSAKISALAKNWLKQSAVSRNTVFLLGFGLEMSADDVSEFLKKGILEGDFYFRNPREVIFRHCYENGLGYQKASELTEAYHAYSNSFFDALLEEKTVGAKRLFGNVKDSAELVRLLAKYNLSVEIVSGVTVQTCFNLLYDECRQIIAESKQAEYDRTYEEKLSGLKGSLLRNRRLFDFEKKREIENYRSTRKVFTITDVTESDVEKHLCSGTPVDKNGNLTKISSSALSAHFAKKRLSKQHLTDINTGKSEPDRFDLITLKFFIVAEKNQDESPNTRWWKFVEETNEMLNECSMGELYIANPYDAFLQLCMLTEVPLATYDSVIEKSFEEQNP